MADVDLVEYRDDDGRFSLALPADWEQVQNEAEGVPLAAAEPSALGALRANVVVTVDDVTAIAFTDWQLGNDQLLPGMLKEYQLLDLERLPVAGHEGVRRLATHTIAGGTSATMEQWATAVDSRGYTVTFTVPTLRYAAMAPGLAELARSFAVSEQTGGDAV